MSDIFSYSRLLEMGLTGKEPPAILPRSNDVIDNDLSNQQCKRITQAWWDYADEPTKFLGIVAEIRKELQNV